MANNQVDDLQNAIDEMHCKIQEKEYACNVAQLEYMNLCSQVDSNYKHLQGEKIKLQQLETQVNCSKFRLNEYEKSHKDLTLVAANTRKSVDIVKEKISKEENNMQEEDKLFDEDIIELAERLCQYRESYDKNALSEELQDLYEQNSLVSQELEQIKECIIQLKNKFPLTPDESFEKLTQTMEKQRHPLQRDIDTYKTTKQLIKQKTKILEAKKSALYQDLQSMPMNL